MAIIASVITAGGFDGYLEEVPKDQSWDSAIDDPNSVNYTITNESLVLNDGGDVVTQEVDTSSKTGVEVTAEVQDGNVTVSVYDDNATQLYSESVSGTSTVTYQVADDVDGYHIEYVNDQTADSTVDSYNVAHDQSSVGNLMTILVVGVIGAAVLIIFN